MAHISSQRSGEAVATRDADRHRTSSDRSMTTMLLLGLSVAFVTISGFTLWASDLTSGAIWAEVGKAALTLVVGVVLGGVLKQALDDHARRSADREAAHVFLERVLDDLKGVLDQVENARLLITAHQSAKSYGEQMRDLIGARVVLLRLKRSLADNRTMMEKSSEVEDQLKRMIKYLEDLAEEYEAKYWRAADAQRFDEELTRRRVAVAVSESIDHQAREEVVQLPRRSQLAWALLCEETEFPKFNQFIKEFSEGDFYQCYDLAKGVVQRQL